MIHTPINITFKGLTHSPSDYACQDGELGACLNLIPEDGELHIISPSKVEEDFAIPDDAKIMFVHKVTHNEEPHTHYIIQRNDSIYWIEKGASSYNPTQIYSGKVNSITAIGNVLCFIEDSATKYAYWKNDKYITFCLSDINYSIEISDTMGQIGGMSKDNGSIFGISTILTDEDWETSFKNYDTVHTELTPDPTLKGSSIIFNSIDALINKRMSELGEEWFKYLSFGVVALRLYDGTYTNISNPFVLAPNAISNKFLYLKSKKSIASRGYLHKHSIRISLELTEGLEDIITGATVFLTAPESFIDTDKPPLRIDNKYNPFYSSEMTSDTCSAAFYFKGEKDIYSLVDSMHYYKSIDIDIDELGKDITLKTISQTSETIPLSDMERTSWGGKCSITYNNRLHIANVKKSIVNAFASLPFNEIAMTDSNKFDMNASGCYLNSYLKVGNLEKAILCDAVFELYIGDVASIKKIYYRGKLQYPIPPILSFPDTKASRLTIYIYVENISKYYKIDVGLHNSSTFGMSYYVNLGDREIGSKALFGTGNSTSPKVYANYGFDNLGLPQFLQYEKFKLSEATWEQDSTSNMVTIITEDEYNSALEKVNKTTQYTEMYPSLTKVSEAENPLVFPAKNSVQVGSAIIQAIAANTRPISEGQFGDAPLYVFTDEGLWVLMLGEDGTYYSRQPVNRYICSDPSGILQIDDAVVFPTEQGIMLQRGRETECITDVLNAKGSPFSYTNLPSAKSILETGSIKVSSIDYAHFRNFLVSAKMIFDYYDSRIILFNPNYDYAYVYSLRSKEWGAMENNIKDKVDFYPNAYAVDRNNRIVNLYNPEPTASEKYMLCTRPITFGSNSFKTIFDIYANGFFPPTQIGKCGIAIYGSNNLNRWYLIATGELPRLQLLGSPYKYFRVALIGSLSAGETLSGFLADIQERWQNTIR